MERPLRRRRQSAMIPRLIAVALCFVTLLSCMNLVARTEDDTVHWTTTLALKSDSMMPKSVSSNGRFLLGHEEDSEDDDVPDLTLEGLRILAAIASFDFSQRPHTEELLDSYHDLCSSGAVVDVYVYSARAYPVVLIDMLNSRFDCQDFRMFIILKPGSVRLHLVDFHRALFYDKLMDYDIFIYSEDDMRITPHTVATYWQETKKVSKQLLLQNSSSSTTTYQPSDFNVGIVRYEYNFPSVVMNDITGQATTDVSRVYWEHSSVKPPMVPNALAPVPHEPFKDKYVTMTNNHQGMFLATRDLLQAWRDRPGCQFNIASNRPGTNRQHFIGTQRVWMSSSHLYSKKFGCGVQQIIPIDKFASLTVHHLPNKNYRRVGKYRSRDFSKSDIERPLATFLTATQMHLTVRREYPLSPQTNEYNGPIRVIDEVDKWRTPILEKNLKDYYEYVQRGGVLTNEQLQH